MEDAARKLDDLAKQMSGREADADRANRLARRQEKLADEAEKQSKDTPGSPQSAEARRTQNEIAREAEQLRGGEQGRTAKRNADRALEEAQTAQQPQDQAKAQRQAATAMRELADRIASRKEPAAVADPEQRDRAGPDGPNMTIPGMPTRHQGAKARELANEQRKLRDAVRKAASEDRATNPKPADDPLGELAKTQTEVARQTKELARDVTRDQGEQSPLSRHGDNAQRATQEAAADLQNGELPGARKAGKEAATRFHQLAEDLARTPRGENENPDKDLLRRTRDLARQQDAINRAAAEQDNSADNRRARQQARQQELRKQAGELEKDLEKLRQEMANAPQAGDAAGQAARAARDAQRQMEQSSRSPSGSNRPQDQAAKSLDRSAQQADRAASEQSAAADGRGQQKSSSPEAGQALRQAQGQMDQAQNQLGNGEPGKARGSMEKAAKSLRQAAGQLAQSGSRPNPESNPDPANSPGPAPGGRPDASVFGAAAAKYGGKTWGELPGELRTKIVQDMKAKYGEDYARMIKLYFEQLADTKRDVK
jgi:hypothetical protein